MNADAFQPAKWRRQECWPGTYAEFRDRYGCQVMHDGTHYAITGGLSRLRVLALGLTWADAVYDFEWQRALQDDQIRTRDHQELARAVRQYQTRDWPLWRRIWAWCGGGR